MNMPTGHGHIRARSSSPPIMRPNPSNAERDPHSPTNFSPTYSSPKPSPLRANQNGVPLTSSPVRDQSLRSTSAPPRANHTPRRRPMYFADKPPGTLFRSSPQKRRKSPSRMPSANLRGPAQLAKSPLLVDTTQSIRAWLHQQVQIAQLGDADIVADAGIEAHNQEGQPSSPKLLSARSPATPHTDANNETNGWIISPVPPPSTTKSPVWPRSRHHDRSESRRSHAFDTSSDTSSEGARRRRTSPLPVKKGVRGNAYQVSFCPSHPIPNPSLPRGVHR